MGDASRRRLRAGRVRTVIAGLAAALIVAAAAGCTASVPGHGAPVVPASDGSTEPVVTVGLPGTLPADLHPLSTATAAATRAEILTGILPEPFHVAADDDLVWNDDLLAEAPESTVSGDVQTVTYRMRPEAVWSDGTPVSAADFAYTWQASLCPPASAGAAPALGLPADDPLAAGYERIEAVDDFDDGATATVRLSPPYADWAALFQLLPAHLLETGDPAQDCAAVDAGWPLASGLPDDISAGPWRLLAEDIDPTAGRLTLTANPDWWGDPPALDRIELTAVPDPSVLPLALAAGEIGACRPWFEPQLLSALTGYGTNVTLDVHPGLDVEHLDFNTRNPHLADRAVRQAIALALDREQILDLALGPVGGPDPGVLNNRFWVPGQPAYSDTSGGEYDAPDLTEARVRLEQAGYATGPDGVYVKDGVPLSLRLSTGPDPLRVQIATVIADQLDALGVRVTTEVQPDFYLADPAAAGSLASGQWDLAVYPSPGSAFVADKPSRFRTSTAQDPGLNPGLGGTSEVDDLLTELAEQPDPGAWSELTDEADERLWTEMFSLPLFQSPGILAHDPGYVGPTLNPNEPLLWNAAQWRVR